MAVVESDGERIGEDALRQRDEAALLRGDGPRDLPEICPRSARDLPKIRPRRACSAMYDAIDETAPVKMCSLKPMIVAVGCDRNSARRLRIFSASSKYPA